MRWSLISYKVFGIDIGRGGAVACIDVSEYGDGVSLSGCVSKFTDDIDKNIGRLKAMYFGTSGVARYIFIEQQRIVFGQKGAAAHMSNYGQLLGASKMICADVATVQPATWQRHVHGHSTSLKRDTIEWAQKMFEYDKLSDGEADAFGIAYHGYLQLSKKK